MVILIPFLGKLEGLADLATNSSYVQNIIATYLKDLMSLGVAGFRIGTFFYACFDLRYSDVGIREDAAKNMNPGDIADIKSIAGGSPYLTQEVYVLRNQRGSAWRDMTLIWDA